MFSGRHFHNIDAKGRVAVPRDYRDALLADNQTHVVVTLSPDETSSYLDIYPADKWREIVEDYLENGFEGLDHADAMRAREAFLHNYVHSAQPQQLDGSGRILVPQEHRSAVHFEKEVVFTGDVKKFRLWPVSEWRRANEEAEGNKAMIRNGNSKWF